MWFVYWIVTACITAVEELTFLRSLPLYSVVRLLLSVWLIYPITNFASLRNQSKVLTYDTMQSEWGLFASDGCGLIYFQYLVPFLEKKSDVMANALLLFRNKLSPQVISSFVPGEVSSLGRAITRASSSSSDDLLKLRPDTYLQNLTGLVGTMFSHLMDATDKVDPLPVLSVALMSDKDFSEYTVVDKTEVDITQRMKPQNVPVVDEGKEESSLTSSKRFFWQ